MDRVLETGTMTGLMDTFRRHFRVLTNFTEYEVKSRPIGPEAGFARGEGLDSEAGPGSPQGGLEWVVQGFGRPVQLLPTHPPLQGGPAPCGRWSALDLLEQRGR